VHAPGSSTPSFLVALLGETPGGPDAVSDGLLVSAYLGGHDLEAQRLIAFAGDVYNGSFGHQEPPSI
jgi:hypothetical protein